MVIDILPSGLRCPVVWLESSHNVVGERCHLMLWRIPVAWLRSCYHMAGELLSLGLKVASVTWLQTLAGNPFTWLESSSCHMARE